MGEESDSDLKSKVDEQFDDLEKAFDRAQKGYDDDETEIVIESGSDGGNENIQSDVDICYENDEEFGMTADINAEFIPKRKRQRDFDEPSEYEQQYENESDDVQIGAEPAGQGEDNVFDLMIKREQS